MKPHNELSFLLSIPYGRVNFWVCLVEMVVQAYFPLAKRSKTVVNFGRFWRYIGAWVADALMDGDRLSCPWIANYSLPQLGAYKLFLWFKFRFLLRLRARMSPQEFRTWRNLMTLLPTHSTSCQQICDWVFRWLARQPHSKKTTLRISSVELSWPI